MKQQYEFQQKTIDAACAHLQAHTRVLCADEAGLGKTFVARGVLERLAEQKLESLAAVSYGKQGTDIQDWWDAFCEKNANAMNTHKEYKWQEMHDFLCGIDPEYNWQAVLYGGSKKNYKKLISGLTGIKWWNRYRKNAETWTAFYKAFIKGLRKLFIVENGTGRQTDWEFKIPTDHIKDPCSIGRANLPAEPFRVLYVCCNLDIAAQNTTRLVPDRQNSDRKDISKPDRLSTLWYYKLCYPTPYLEIMPITATLAARDTPGSATEAKILDNLLDNTDEKPEKSNPRYKKKEEKKHIIETARSRGEAITAAEYKPDLIIFDEFQNFGQIMNTASGKLDDFAKDAKDAEEKKALEALEADLKRVSAFCTKFVGDTPQKDKAKILMLSATPFHRSGKSTDVNLQHRLHRLEMADIIKFMGGDPTAYEGLTTAAARENYLYNTCGIFRTERIRLMGKDNAAYHLLKCDGSKLLPFGAYLRGEGQGNVASRAIGTTPHLNRVRDAYTGDGVYYPINPDIKLHPVDHPRYRRLLDVVTADDANDVTEEFDPGRLRGPDEVKKLLWIPPVKPSHRLGGVFARYKSYSKTLVFSDLRITPPSVTELLNLQNCYRAAAIDRAALAKALEDYLNKNNAKRFVPCADVLAGYLCLVGGNAFADVGSAIRYCENGCLADVLNEFADLQESNPVDALKTALAPADAPLYGQFAMAMDAATTGVCRDAFNTPFLPFVLMTTSIGTEGLDFHLYCNRLAHYTCPANVVELEQKNGRIDRRRSLAQRRWWAMPGATFRKTYTFGEMSERSGGLVPDWDAGENNLHYYFFYNEFTDEHSELDELFDEQNTYRRALGVNKELLPELMNLSPFLRKKHRAELHWFFCGKPRRKLHGK